MPVLVFATNNKHKLKEARSILPLSIELKSLADIGCTDELPETGSTLEANSLQKARYVYEKFGLPCFSDDTGLEVDALSGAPGVYSARYAGPNATSAQNLSRLLREMTDVYDRKAKFRTVISLLGIGDLEIFSGAVDGTLLDSPRGDDGFGYDPVFVPVGYRLTFSEMAPHIKNSLRHRGIALRLMTDWLQNRMKSGF
ncbi:MAG: RdgB/HAM1 family non-canonical purine NTP pyrophosphatase [Bacteroidota bacterium]